MDILTFEEVVEVDKALLTSQDKFLARIALYSLRSLKQISQETQQPIESITPEQITAWIDQDETVKQQIETDQSFGAFFSRLVVASLKPLHQAAEATGVAIGDLTIAQVVAWFERQAKEKLEMPQS